MRIVHLFLLSCLMAAVVPLSARRVSSPPDTSGFPGWPSLFEGRALTPLALSETETRFADGFQGKVGRFHDGQRELVFRWVSRPTRDVHRASVCFRGAGYRVTPQPPLRDARGRNWSVFSAVKGADRLRVRSRIYDESGGSWPDISSWYWSAALGRSAGPWWAVTVAEVGEVGEVVDGG